MKLILETEVLIVKQRSPRQPLLPPCVYAGVPSAGDVPFSYGQPHWWIFKLF